MTFGYVCLSNRWQWPVRTISQPLSYLLLLSSFLDELLQFKWKKQETKGRSYSCARHHYLRGYVNLIATVAWTSRWCFLLPFLLEGYGGRGGRSGCLISLLINVLFYFSQGQCWLNVLSMVFGNGELVNFRAILK